MQEAHSRNETEGTARKPVRFVNASNQLTEAGKIGTHRKDGALGIRNSLIKRIPDGPASSVKLALHTVSRNKSSADESCY
jgi:hypothetical protein